MTDVRAAIQDQVHKLVGFGEGTIDLDAPRGDTGLFGPDSVSWRIHGDFTSMMIGGVSALLLQMLHPGALAGVWDHSNFHHDMLGRLKRTAQFIAGTTYGSEAQALGLIERVRSIHDRVHGVLSDGTAYSANDPKLLTWVHVAETSALLASFLRYRDPALPLHEQDRYFAEAATVARLLGAADIPETRRDADAYLSAIRPQLRCDTRTRTVANALLSQPAPSLAFTPFRSLMLEAGVDLLPDWAIAMHGLRLPAPKRPAIRAGVRGVGTMLRWALRDGSAARARRRVAT